MTAKTLAAMNTDREIWREREEDYYADSIHVTEHGGIGINCGGSVFVKPVRAWHKLAQDHAALLAERPDISRIAATIRSRPVLAHWPAMMAEKDAAALESLAAKVAEKDAEIAILKNSDAGMLRTQMYADLKAHEAQLAERDTEIDKRKREDTLRHANCIVAQRLGGDLPCEALQAARDEIAKLKYDIEQSQRHCSAAIEDFNNIKGHAEAMAVEIRASYWGGNPSTALAAYRRDYPEES